MVAIHRPISAFQRDRPVSRRVRLLNEAWVHHRVMLLFFLHPGLDKTPSIYRSLFKGCETKRMED